MNTQDAITKTLKSSSAVLHRYVDDFSDAELMQRPGPGCNHIAWQLGHLIASENQLLEMVAPGAGVELPAGFVEQHSKEKKDDDNPEHFLSKQSYQELFEKVHAASYAAIAKMSDAELDKPGPARFQPMFPTVGDVVILIATHGLMHAGQFVPVRRKLGKPVVM
jgi:hypothetical protein